MELAGTGSISLSDKSAEEGVGSVRDESTPGSAFPRACLGEKGAEDIDGGLPHLPDLVRQTGSPV